MISPLAVPLPIPIHYPTLPSAPPLQLFNVAYARHELIGDTTDVSLSWLEAGGKRSVEELQRQEQEAG